MADTQTSEWIEHGGKAMPVGPDEIVDLKWGNGGKSVAERAGDYEWDIPTDRDGPDFGNGFGIIVAYRVVKP